MLRKGQIFKVQKRNLLLKNDGEACCIPGNTVLENQTQPPSVIYIKHLYYQSSQHLLVATRFAAPTIASISSGPAHWTKHNSPLQLSFITQPHVGFPGFHKTTTGSKFNLSIAIYHIGSGGVGVVVVVVVGGMDYTLEGILGILHKHRLTGCKDSLHVL